jgi:hypothetical protein
LYSFESGAPNQTMRNTNDDKLFQKFISSIRLLLVLGQIFGMIPFSHREKHFRSSNTRIVGNIFLTCVVASFTIYLLYDCAIDTTGLPLQTTTNVLCLCSGLIFAVTILINNLTNRNKFMQFLVKFFDFDRQISTESVLRMYRKTKKQIVKYFITKHSILVIYIVFHIAIIPRRDIFSYKMMQVYACSLTVFSSIFCHQSFGLIFMLKMRFVILNQQVNTLVKHFSNQDLSPIEKNYNMTEKFLFLSKICALHHHLSKLIKLFNDTFGLNMLVMFGLSFVIITIALFYASIILQSPHLEPTVLAYVFLTCLCYGIDCFYICDVCYSTIEQVSFFGKKWCGDCRFQVNKIGVLIHQIETENQDIVDEIEMFSLQIANEKVEFSAAGFFPINYTLIFSVS